jgi:peptidoglycan/LPS O-acetylase OafA/YrhL
MTPTTSAPATPRLLQSVVIPPGAFRLVLAAAVLFSHVTRADVGRLAVLLFFYLSGYWTARIWREKFGPGATLRFYAARYLRIAPLYSLIMFAAAFLLHMPIHTENWTLLGVATTRHDPTGVAWSLDIELEFYLLVPLIAAWVSRAGTLVSIIVAIAIGALGCWLGEAFGIITVAKYLPAFILGTLTFAEAWRPSTNTAYLSLAAFAAMTVITGLTPFLDKRVADPFDIDIWSFFWMLPLLPYVARSLTVKSTRLDRHFGNLSYPLYLVHFGVLALARAAMGESLKEKVVGCAISVAVAVIVYVVVDRPVDRWRVRLTESEKPKPPAAPTAQPATELTG